jgi:hypothetical protein
MKLYQINGSTLNILQSLRDVGNGGYFGSGRGVGKSTALSIRAQELLDQGDRVVMATGYSLTFVLNALMRDLLGAEDYRDAFRSKRLQVTSFNPCLLHYLPGASHFLLLDEPYLLDWGGGDWLFARHTFKRVESVGRWEKI